MTDSLDSLPPLQPLIGRLFDESLVPTLVLDLETMRIVVVNAAAIRFFGWPRPDLIGQLAGEFVADPVTVSAIRYRGAPETGGVSVRKVRTAAGIRVAEVHATGAVDDSHFFIQLVDITDLVAAATATPESTPESPAPEASAPHDASSITETVLEISSIGTVVVDLSNGSIEWCNDAFARLVDRPDSQLLDTAIAAVLRSSGDASDIIDTLRRFGGDIRQDVVLGDRHHVMAYGSTGPRRARAVLQFIVLARPAAGAPPADDAPPAAPPQSLSIGERRARRWLGASAGLIGALTLVGWFIDSQTLVQPISALAPMSPAAGLSFVVFAIMLGEPLRDPSRALRTLLPAGIVIASVLSIVSRLGNHQFSLDDVMPVVAVQPPFDPADTSIAGAVVVLALAIAMGLRIWWPGRSVLAVQALLTVASAMVLLSALGFIYSFVAGDLLTRSAGTPARAVVCLGLVTTAAWLPVRRVGVFAPVVQPLAGGRFARRVMPAAFVAVVAASIVAAALRRVEIIGNSPLEMAFATVMVVVTMFGLFIYTGGRVNHLDGTAADAQKDLETVLAAFSDRHYRIGSNGLARPVNGTSQTSSTPAAALVPAESRDELLVAIAHAQATDTGRRLTYQPESGVGRFEVRIESLSGGDVAMSIYDVSELAAVSDSLAALTERLEDEVRARTAELERTNADLEQFAYLASHDLQEPLRMVSTFVTKLAAHIGELDERGQTYVDFAVDGAQRMSELIDGLLRYSRAGREIPNVADVELDTVVMVVVQSLWTQIEASSAVVAVTSSLPRVRADEALLRQILQNLIANSLRFVEHDRSPVVDIAGTVVGDMVEVSVTDNGVGVPPRFAEQVFLMFRRLNGRAAYPGTGIGLSLVQRLVEAHGGEVWLDPDHGPPGARFRFTLPAAGTYTVRAGDA